MTNGARELAVTLALLYALAFTAVPHAQQSGSPATTVSPPTSSVPHAVLFNGQVLLPNGEARTGTALLTFGLYTDQKDGAPLWTEQQLVTLDASGRYAAILGSASGDGLPADAFAAGTPKWLGVQVEGEPEQPRIMLLSVPYALKAGDADTIGGTPASEFVVRANLFDTVKSTLKAEGYAPRPSNPTTSVPGVLAVFTDTSNSVGNSNVVQNGSNIGINVSPSYPLHVFGATGGPFGYQTLRLDNPHIAGSSFTLGPTFPGAHVYSILSSGPASALGAGSLGVYDEGVGQFRLVIAPNGNVGIGTTAPGAKLHLNGAAEGIRIQGSAPGAPNTAFMAFVDSAGTRIGYVGDGSSNDQSTILDSDVGDVVLRTAAGRVLTATSTGNVGIGTTTPLSQFHVSSTAANSTTLVLENTSDQASPDQLYLSTYGTTGAGNYWSGLDSANTSSLFGPNLFVLRATGGLAFSGSSAAEHMRISTNGNVGIGTMNPTSTSKVEIIGQDGLRLTGYQPFLTLTDTNSSNERALIQNLNGGLAFYPSGSLGGNPHMTLTKTGRLGIGNTTPGTRLSVWGSSNPNEIVFDLGGPGGYEFYVTTGGLVRLALEDHPTTNHVCIGGTLGGYLNNCSSAAEYVPTLPNAGAYPEAADLVSLAGVNPYGDEHAPFAVGQSTTACDPNLIGFLLEPNLGADGRKLNDHYLPLAIYGYFPARVTLENGPIKRGDPITSSSKAGAGMKSTGACRIIGYALEDADVDGRIQVFANQGESNASSAMELRITALQTENAALKAQNAALDARVAVVEQALQDVLAQRREAQPEPRQR